MATRAVKPKRDRDLLKDWQPVPERAPSIIRETRGLVFRILGMGGLVLTAVGTLAMVAPRYEFHYIIGPGWGFFWFTIGLGLLIMHALNDADLQFRRIYLILGLAILFVSLILHIPVNETFAARFLPIGTPGLLLALVFLIGSLRHETEEAWRSFVLAIIGSIGAFMIFAAVLVGSLNAAFLEVEGVILLTLGLLYVSTFIGMQEAGSRAGYLAGLALGGAGALAFALGLVRSASPAILRWLNQPPTAQYLVPDGFILMGAGIIYMMIAFGACSDRILVVLTRREISAYYYSPIGYLVILGITLVGWLRFSTFVSILTQTRPEPIIHIFVWDILTVLCLIFAVPVITMRSLSEEKRTGTLEVLLTAPVSEVAVVLSKFFAALIFFLTTLIPWWLFLVALRIFGDAAFDYRPLLSFELALICSVSGFLALGLFFSSITRNQIIAAVFTFACLLGLVGLSIFASTASPPWREILRFTSFFELWWNSLQGQVAPRILIFHVSVAVFFLFVTVKVLEARKWT
jgi:ABC-2 type transport system permease protein